MDHTRDSGNVPEWKWKDRLRKWAGKNAVSLSFLLIYVTICLVVVVIGCRT